MAFLLEKPVWAGFAALATCACLSWNAEAATQTTTFTVTALVASNCLINSATQINFGSYTTTAASANGTIQVTCSNGVPYNLGLDAGTSPGATVTTRKMTGSGPDLLNYGLFQDAAFTTNWGNTVGADTVPGTGTGASQSYTVYGQLPAGQFVFPGNYHDIITTTLTF